MYGTLVSAVNEIGRIMDIVTIAEEGKATYRPFPSKVTSDSTPSAYPGTSRDSVTEKAASSRSICACW